MPILPLGGPSDMIAPLKMFISGSTLLRREDMTPPVKDSPTVSVMFLARNLSSTTVSIVSSSTPNTISPSNSRKSVSSLANMSNAAASSLAFAVIRTLIPSMPLAKKASVGLPILSNWSIRSARTSARPDSLFPQVRSTRLRMTVRSPDRS